jgi:hypothetical protein
MLAIKCRPSCTFIDAHTLNVNSYSGSRLASFVSIVLPCHIYTSGLTMSFAYPVPVLFPSSTHKVLPHLLHRRIHVQLLSIPPPPLHRIRTHLHARPHPPRLSSMRRENLYTALALSPSLPSQVKHTFVPDHPSRNAASFATSSPNPSISPFTNGSSRFIAAPRRRPKSEGVLYRMRGEEDEDDAGEGAE